MSLTILLVEDDYDVREALAETLSDEGYEIHCAADGLEALDYLRGGGRPGLILLDLMMPRMSGSEFRLVQKRDPLLSQIPVVLLSADIRAREMAVTLAADGVLRKPIDLPDLLNVIGRFRAAPVQ